jgi:phosphoribosyl 1,2-cyclic phosphate phosphodiesterase
VSLRFTILGCGSSGGVPRIGGNWGACDPSNPKNNRKRCSLLVEKIGPKGTTTVLIDTSPDMRQQLIDAQVSRLEGVIYTHSHADHLHGLDDLRQLALASGGRIDVWADKATRPDLLTRFAYAFEQPVGSDYPPILNLHKLVGDVSIEGPGGTITLEPIEVNHGRIDALGFRIGTLAYIPDVLEIFEHSWPKLNDLDVFIIDALRYKPHPSHAHLDLALSWIKRAAPKRAVLTNMHIDLDYTILDAETEHHITPAFDGMVIDLKD